MRALYRARPKVSAPIEIPSKRNSYGVPGSTRSSLAMK
jgi:hypothetical protein